MAAAEEIRTKIKSIEKTRKIMSAMEMVAASKVNKARKTMDRSRPYAKKMYQVIQHLARSHSEFNHPYLAQREIKRVGYVVVSTDRGLCGGLNVNLFKQLIKHMHGYQEQNIPIDLFIIGKKGHVFFDRVGGNIIGVASHLGDRPRAHDLIGVVKVMLDAYEAETVDAVYLVFNEFINTMSQAPFIEQLLPLKPAEEKEFKTYWDYIYEPDDSSLLEVLLARYIESQVYQAVVENIACQQAATMVAMKSATDNAKEIIDDFQRIYNKARQAAITQEISEIVSGAAAV